MLVLVVYDVAQGGFNLACRQLLAIGCLDAVAEENTIQEVVRLVKVETGNTVDNVIQIKSGVNVGERIVVEGMRVLSDGAVVKDISK